jgi:hypothetical protein
LPAEKKGSVVKFLDVKSVEHKGQKRKLLLAKDGTVYKVKRLKLENSEKAGQHVSQLFYLCKIVLFRGIN